ncbi:MAG: RNA methyltransferase [bacterium]|nr:RNA methyltransferase [Candidatus Colisoma equi]
MNRILFESGEIRNGVATFGDVRAEHVLNVLHGEVGQVLKTGEVNGLIGTGVIKSIETSCCGDLSSEHPSNRPSDHVRMSVSVCHEEESLKPWVDLILAPPRPRVMKRLLPQLAAMGVGRIFLVGAKKVEKDFWGATLLKEENYRPLLIDGLMQAGTSILPTLETRRNFRKFVREELDTLWPKSKRIVAHPYDASHQVQSSKFKVQSPVVLAIGPEGGWTDEEVALLGEYGFARYSLGSRILRTDTAAIALLAQLMKEFGVC